jgi:hypothetical protein
MLFVYHVPAATFTGTSLTPRRSISMATPLPGFYFDVEKNRYFKITPNHLSPKGFKYSADAIKRQRKHLYVGFSPH